MNPSLAILAIWAAFIAGFHFAKWDSAHGYRVGYAAGNYVHAVWKGEQ